MSIASVRQKLFEPSSNTKALLIFTLLFLIAPMKLEDNQHAIKKQASELSNAQNSRNFNRYKYQVEQGFKNLLSKEFLLLDSNKNVVESAEFELWDQHFLSRFAKGESNSDGLILIKYPANTDLEFFYLRVHKPGHVSTQYLIHRSYLLPPTTPVIYLLETCEVKGLFVDQTESNSLPQEFASQLKVNFKNQLKQERVQYLQNHLRYQFLPTPIKWQGNEFTAEIPVSNPIFQTYLNYQHSKAQIRRQKLTVKAQQCPLDLGEIGLYSGFNHKIILENFPESYNFNAKDLQLKISNIDSTFFQFLTPTSVVKNRVAFEAKQLPEEELQLTFYFKNQQLTPTNKLLFFRDLEPTIVQYQDNYVLLSFVLRNHNGLFIPDAELLPLDDIEKPISFEFFPPTPEHALYTLKIAKDQFPKTKKIVVFHPYFEEKALPLAQIHPNKINNFILNFGKKYLAGKLLSEQSDTFFPFFEILNEQGQILTATDQTGAFALPFLNSQQKYFYVRTEGIKSSLLALPENNEDLRLPEDFLHQYKDSQYALQEEEEQTKYLQMRQTKQSNINNVPLRKIAETEISKENNSWKEIESELQSAAPTENFSSAQHENPIDLDDEAESQDVEESQIPGNRSSSEENSEQVK